MRVAVFLTALLWACCSFAQAKPAEPMVFRMAFEQLDESSIQVAGGIEVRAADWPALIFAQITRTTILDKKPSTCTATLLGPNAVLTAAHCVDTFDGQAIVEPKLGIGARVMPLTCSVFPPYLKLDEKARVPRGSEDYALCRIEDGGNTPEVLRQLTYEVVEADTGLAAGDKVLVTGYGCTMVAVIDGDLETIKGTRTLNIGDSFIERASGGVPGQPMYVTTRSVEAKGVSLCPGDSGGPLISGVSEKDPDGVRRVRAVNSMIATDRRMVEVPATNGIGKTTKAVYDVVSSMSSIASPAFREWAQGWAQRNKVSVCGINARAGTGQCRR